MNEMIYRLNDIARKYEDDGMSALEAIEQVACDMGYEEVETQGANRIYRSPNGSLINAWIKGVSSDHIEEGGLGFNNQVGWYTLRDMK